MPWGDRQPNVLTVTREEMPVLAGLPWEEAITRKGDAVERITYGYVVSESDRPGWQPPKDKNGTTLKYLPLNHAWLREIDGRAFLYLQNW